MIPRFKEFPTDLADSTACEMVLFGDVGRAFADGKIASNRSRSSRESLQPLRHVDSQRHLIQNGTPPTVDKRIDPPIRVLMPVDMFDADGPIELRVPREWIVNVQSATDLLARADPCSW